MNTENLPTDFEHMSTEEQIAYLVEHEEECDLLLHAGGLQLTNVGAARLNSEMQGEEDK